MEKQFAETSAKKGMHLFLAFHTGSGKYLKERLLRRILYQRGKFIKLPGVVPEINLILTEISLEFLQGKGPLRELAHKRKPENGAEGLP